MSVTVKSISEGDKTWYGTTQIQEFPVVVLKPIQLVGFVPCEIETEDCRNEPCIILPVFADVDTGDKNTFLFQFPSDDNSVTLIDDYRLEKLVSGVWTEVVSGNPDNTLGAELGQKFTFGSFPEYPLYSGYSLDWNKVLNFGAGGVGQYRFKVHNVFDTDSPLLSTTFELKEDTDCNSKDGTFSIKTSNKGKYRNFRYTRQRDDLQSFDLINIDDGWEDQIRIAGRITEESPEIEESFVKLGSYQNKLHLTDDFASFTLTIFKYSTELYKRALLYGMRGQDITITDSNSDATYNFTDFDIISKGEAEIGETYVNNRLIYNASIGIQSAFDGGFRQC